MVNTDIQSRHWLSRQYVQKHLEPQKFTWVSCILNILTKPIFFSINSRLYILFTHKVSIFIISILCRSGLFIIRLFESTYLKALIFENNTFQFFKIPSTDIFLLNFNPWMQPSYAVLTSLELSIPVKKIIYYFEIYDRLSLVW